VESILVLEDDPAIMRFFRTILNAYTVLEATNVEEAFQSFREHSRTLGLLIADVILPAGSGIDVALAVRHEIPEMPIILTSGYPESMWGDSYVRNLNQIGTDLVRIVHKPFSPGKLLMLVSDLLQKPRHLARVAGAS
jgi:DNA-binding NtrC family response regulator